MRKRNHAITVRLSDEEYDKLQNNVAESGHTQQSYIINSVLANRISSSEEIDTIKGMAKSLADIDIQLRGIGTNLNQMAHVANGKGIVPTEEVLEGISSVVVKMRKEANDVWQSIRSLIQGQVHQRR